MAAMSTALTRYSTKENSVTFKTSGHTFVKPELVVQTRRPAIGNQVNHEDQVQVVLGTEDAEGNPLQSKINFTVVVRRPITGIAGDLTAAMAIFRDIVASDEFTAMVSDSSLLA